jgi:hypothetical protein
MAICAQYERSTETSSGLCARCDPGIVGAHEPPDRRDLTDAIQRAAEVACQTRIESNWRARKFVAYLCGRLDVSHPDLAERLEAVLSPDDSEANLKLP